MELGKVLFSSLNIRRSLFVCILILISGVLNLNQTNNYDKQSVGGYSAINNEQIVPLSLGADIRLYNNAITKLLENHNFNGNVLVARYGIVLYKRSFGYGDFANNTSLNDSTAFQVASISKTFTATAILLLQHRGLLDLDDRVSEHIPEFPYEKITIRHLLNHTSGLQNYMWLIENRWNKERKPTNEDVLEMFVKYNQPVNFQPGHRFEYSNTGYAFLALVVERITGNSFAQFLEQNIFEPLEMNNTFVNDVYNSANIENLAHGYRRFRSSYLRIPHNYIDGVVGDKGVYSSTVDLLKWDNALYKNTLMPENLMNKAYEYSKLNNGREINYGLGWRLQTFLDRKVVYHPGRWNGYRTSFRRFIDDNATIIVLNNTNRNITHLVRELQSIVFHDENQNYTVQN